jgi:hypothetical protein
METAYRLYAKETIKFEFKGHSFEMDVVRLPMKEQMRFSLKATRLDEQSRSKDREIADDALVAGFELQGDMLAYVVEDLRGFEDLDEWPKEHAERVKILCHDSDFLIAAMGAYNAFKLPNEVKEGK